MTVPWQRRATCDSAALHFVCESKACDSPSSPGWRTEPIQAAASDLPKARSRQRDRLRSMADENTTVVLGIPIPSTDPIFLAIVGIHILFGLAALTTGAVAMPSKKGRGRHSNLGAVYFWCLFGVFVTMSTLSSMRWVENYHLFILGVISFASAYFGRAAARWHWRQWPRLHLTGMGASYISMLTAFYVDNGKNLPPMDGASGNCVLVAA